MRRKVLLAAAVLLGLADLGRPAAAAAIKVLTAGAFKQVLLEAIPAFEKETGNKVTVDNDTVGALVKRVDGGEAFDVVIVSPGAIEDLAKKGKVVAGSVVNLARVGVGVMVKDVAAKLRKRP